MQDLWDEGDRVRPPAFRDLNINDTLLQKYNIPKFRDYDYATALFPMWAGVATEQQAQSIVENIMPKLMSPYGLNTSNRKNTGNQWDEPILWAPLQIVAMEALERYGYYEEAWKIGTRYSKMIMDEYGKTGGMWEKAESKTGTVTNVWKFITNGYTENDKGFAWTNSAMTEIMMSLPRLLQKMQGKKIEEPGVATTEVVATEGRPVMPVGEHPVPQHSGGYEPLKLLNYESTSTLARTR